MPSDELVEQVRELMATECLAHPETMFPVSSDHCWWCSRFIALRAKVARLEAERHEMREVLELLMMDEWGYRETEAPDVQEVLTARGILVERPAPPNVRDEWDSATWMVFRWSDAARGETDAE